MKEQVETWKPAATGLDGGIPLVVDLDGTLTTSDLLLESALRLLRCKPLYLFLFPLWLLRGKHVLKMEIAKRVRLDPALLPYNEELVVFLHAQRRAGQPIVLATASTRLLAESVFKHFQPLFTELLCSDDSVNLKGRRKRDAIVARFGIGAYDYAGDAVADLSVWAAARRAIVVNPPWWVRARTARLPNLARSFPRKSSVFAALMRSLRIHQWMKNLLLFVPLMASHNWNNIPAVAQALAAFAAFSLMASGVYQINDILDLDHDRAHRNKRHRPIASGELPIAVALFAALALLGAALGVAYSLSLATCGVLVAYALLTSAYSFWLKAHPIIDLVVLACLYSIRIVGGAVAIEVVPSYWLLTFSMFVFLSLASLKRCAELVGSSAKGTGRLPGRGYSVADLNTLTSLGTAFGAGAVMVLALYINADASARLYAHAEILWLLCPVLVYWLGHMWLKTGRGEMHDDPIVFAVRDKASIAAALFGLAVMLVATL